MITRRDFLKRASILSGLVVGIKPFALPAPEKTQWIDNPSVALSRDGFTQPPQFAKVARPSIAILDNFSIEVKDDEWIYSSDFESLDYHEDITFLAGDDNRFTTRHFREQSRPLSMPKLDNAGVDTKKLRQLFDGGDTDAMVAAKLIQTLDPDNFDSLAQYSECVAGIAREFGL